MVALDFKRTSFKLLRELLSSVPMESASAGLCVHECQSVLKKHFLKAQAQAIPVCPMSG